LRLSSIEPRDVDARLLAALAHERVARHLHVPLQSADDEVLAAMGRPYTYAQFQERVALVRRVLGRAMLSTDVIVGFPTEDEAAFARTLAAVDGGTFGRVHVFAFSPRPGTAAAELPPLPPAFLKERMARALAAAEAAARRARLGAIGMQAEVLVEDRHDGLARGYSSEYVRYYVSGEARPGQLVAVVAEAEHRDGVRGRITGGAPLGGTV
jgi:threonylcarbamoyladenosine tRNA methylthiotransferase MtaB